MLFSLLKHYLDTDTALKYPNLCTVSLLSISISIVAISQEKTLQNITQFDKTQLKHTQTAEGSSRLCKLFPQYIFIYNHFLLVFYYCRTALTFFSSSIPEFIVCGLIFGL